MENLPHIKNRMLFACCIICWFPNWDSANLIHVSSSHGYDLVLGKRKGRKLADQRFTHRLIAEVKHVHYKGRLKRRLKSAEEDIKRLRDSGDKTTRRVLLFFENGHWISREEATRLRMIAKKTMPKVDVFFNHKI